MERVEGTWNFRGAGTGRQPGGPPGHARTPDGRSAGDSRLAGGGNPPRVVVDGGPRAPFGAAVLAGEVAVDGRTDPAASPEAPGRRDVGPAILGSGAGSLACLLRGSGIEAAGEPGVRGLDDPRESAGVAEARRGSDLLGLRPVCPDNRDV